MSLIFLNKATGNGAPATIGTGFDFAGGGRSTTPCALGATGGGKRGVNLVQEINSNGDGPD